MSKIHLRAPYNYDVDAVSDLGAILEYPPSMTQQHQVEDTDINKIVARYLKTGELPPSSYVGKYGDFTGANDFHAAMNTVIAAENAFFALPADLRTFFDNEPGNLAAFMDNLKDPDTMAKAIELGLVLAPEEPQKAGGDRAPQSAPKGAPKPSNEPAKGSEGGTGGA